MIDPPPAALRRSASELAKSAGHAQSTEEASALLLFYAAECSLKSVYMRQNNLRSTAEERGRANSARSFAHDLVRLIDALNIPRSAVGLPPVAILSRTAAHITVDMFHQAWRYGEKIKDTQAILVWLNKIINWCKEQP